MVPADTAAGEVRILGALLRSASSSVGYSTLKRYAVAASVGRAVQPRNAAPLASRLENGSDRSTPQVAAVRAIRQVLGDLSGQPSGDLARVFYSRNDGDTQALQSTRAVERIVQTITSGWANAPVVTVVYDMADPLIPAAVRQADLKQRSGGATGSPEGFFLDGEVYSP